jgi:uncharacterized protein with PQ loop repeat
MVLVDIDPKKEKLHNFGVRHFLKNPQEYKRFITWFMIIVSITETSFLWWQNVTVYTRKSAADLNQGAFIILTVTAFIWLIYSFFYLKDIPMIIENISLFLGSLVLSIGIAMYGDAPRDNITPRTVA